LPSDRAVSQLSQARASLLRKVEKRRFWNIKIESTKYKGKLEKKYAHPPPSIIMDKVVLLGVIFLK
jgi:hypothetical protein